MNDVTAMRIISILPNQKPRMNAEVRTLLRARDSAFRSGDTAALRAARRKLTASIKRAKTAYAAKIQGHFSTNDPRSIKAMTAETLNALGIHLFLMLSITFMLVLKPLILPLAPDLHSHWMCCFPV